ncbi:aspartate dehydrogenase domain-containing protein [Agrococcus casei]|uniref:L-aspartate dehydrogenase n=1 Tax=Agrococcus casei LMG 22410 TaxID=1255656 RepID=A0A1R4G121_9MICO|nr:aspartate dehydrogenase domain-containing protein [Agrococcus casei]SJM61682.1 Aspartate dehydrogenase homolog [Agrococcus casei LMG 22410]
MTRILLLGFGAIGRQLTGLLQPEVSSGRWALQAVVRDVEAHEARGSLGVELHSNDGSHSNDGWRELVDRADLVVECAGVSAARDLGPGVVAAGRDLVLTSVGALAYPDTRAKLLQGPGRLHITPGAIGGFDLLGAAAEADGLAAVRIRTRKLAGSLVQPWMSAEEAADLRALRPGDEPKVVFSGGPADAIKKFPGNVNVAVALAWATRGTGDSATALERSLQRVQVELVADPDAELSSHDIEASGPAGRFRMRFESAPSPENPRTSGLTAISLAHTLRRVAKSAPV